MRNEYKLTKNQLKKLMEACKLVPYQETANRAWEELGNEMGFEYMTVQPVQGKGAAYFTAEEIKIEGER
jgi:hypothetical protein